MVRSEGIAAAPSPPGTQQAHTDAHSHRIFASRAGEAMVGRAFWAMEPGGLRGSSPSGASLAVSQILPEGAQVPRARISCLEQIGYPGSMRKAMPLAHLPERSEKGAHVLDPRRASLGRMDSPIFCGCDLLFGLRSAKEHLEWKGYEPNTENVLRTI